MVIKKGYNDSIYYYYLKTMYIWRDHLGHVRAGGRFNTSSDITCSPFYSIRHCGYIFYKANRFTGSQSWARLRSGIKGKTKISDGLVYYP